MPPTITGQSFVTKQVFDILEKNEWNLKLLKYPNIPIDKFSSLPLKLVLWFLFFFKYSIQIVTVPTLVYLPAARTTLGFLRLSFFIYLAKLFRHKLIIHFHCGEYNDFILEKNIFFKNFIINTFNKVDYSIILGDSLLKNFDLIFNEKMNVVVIPNGIEGINQVDFFSNKYKDEITILFMSNLIESKGYLDLLEAVNLLVNKYGLTKIKCKFCGNFMSSSDDKKFTNLKDAKKYFFNYIKANHLEEYVSFMGSVSGTKKTKIFNESDFFVLPTYYNTEAQPVSILEAMSLGKIIVSTSYRSIPDMIIHNYSGVLINPQSPDEIAKVIFELNNDPIKKKSLSMNAKICFENFFKYNFFEEKILKLFNDA